MLISAVDFARASPKSSLMVRRMRAAITGKPYSFNQQRMRLEVFRELNAMMPFENYIETGTYLGTTTHFLAATASARHAEVHSCELNPEYFALAQRIVGGWDNVHLHCGDSVAFLKSLAPTVSRRCNFVYLDAHWYRHLPLREELAIVKDWSDTVVMIDDFKVPFDTDFEWDSYDAEQEVSLRYIEGSFGDRAVFFPNYPAREERSHMFGGFSRGYCLIPTADHGDYVLAGIPHLKRLDKEALRVAARE